MLVVSVVKKGTLYRLDPFSRVYSRSLKVFMLDVRLKISLLASSLKFLFLVLVVGVVEFLTFRVTATTTSSTVSTKILPEVGSGVSTDSPSSRVPSSPLCYLDPGLRRRSVRRGPPSSPTRRTILS